MKAKELMIGDWVNAAYFNGKREFPQEKLQINSIDNVDKGFLIVEPIPLTPEILEANGFRNEDDIWLSKDYDYGIDNQNGLMEFFKYDGEFIEAKIPRCFYTHQFQHALRLCGLNEMADNFKLTKKGDNDNE